MVCGNAQEQMGGQPGGSQQLQQVYKEVLGIALRWQEKRNCVHQQGLELSQHSECVGWLLNSWVTPAEIRVILCLGTGPLWGPVEWSDILLRTEWLPVGERGRLGRGGRRGGWRRWGVLAFSLILLKLLFNQMYSFGRAIVVERVSYSYGATERGPRESVQLLKWLKAI